MRSGWPILAASRSYCEDAAEPEDDDLLQLAWKLYQERGSRVLLLTYNKALMADLRRLLTLVGVADPGDERSIQVQTVHSFLGSAFHGLGLQNLQGDLLDNYVRLKQEALDLIRGGGITSDDTDRLIRDRSDAFGWDYLLLDEAQDWPEDERDLLWALYPPRQFVIADGMDQLVRSGSHATGGLEPVGRCPRCSAWPLPTDEERPCAVCQRTRRGNWARGVAGGGEHRCPRRAHDSRGRRLLRGTGTARPAHAGE